MVVEWLNDCVDCICGRHSEYLCNDCYVNYYDLWELIIIGQGALSHLMLTHLVLSDSISESQCVLCCLIIIIIYILII